MFFILVLYKNNAYKYYSYENYMEFDDLKEKFQKYFQEKIENVRDIKHKGNNRLYEIKLINRQRYLVKVYSTVQADNWDRGDTEFRAITHFYIKNLNVPKPISFDKEEGIAVYSFEKGKSLDSEEVNWQNIMQAANFLAQVHSLNKEDIAKFPEERTRCLSFNDYIKLLEGRYNRIKNDFVGSEEHRNFVENEVYPKLQELKNMILNLSEKYNINKELELKEQVLTPGDFGFHNILVDKNGKHVFLDFEYCGRDDPVKQILDFLHHDKTKNIGRELKNLFLEQYRNQAQPSDFFEERLKILDSVIGMNWLLIYLGVLNKNYLEHLKFAHQNIGNVVEGRIEKARKKLKNLKYFD